MIRTRHVRCTLAILLAAAAILVTINRDLLDLAALGALIGNLGTMAPAAFVVVYALATVLFVPGALFGLASGALFGPLWGTIWNLVGATLGATLAFLTARYLASDWVSRKAGGRLKQLIEGVEAEGWRFVAVTRLVPLVPFNLLNYALGLTRIPLTHYVVATFACMIPGAAAYTWLGYAGREAAAGNGAAINYGLFGLGLLALMVFLPRWMRRLRGTPIRWLDIAQFERRLDQGGDMVVVDVRGPDEFSGPLGYIAGARNIPLDELPARTNELATAGMQSVVLVCRTDRRSAKAAALLLNAGFRDVLVLRGGMEQWSRVRQAVTGSCDTETLKEISR